MTTHVYETTIIPFSFSTTWQTLRSFDFAFLSSVKESSLTGDSKGDSTVTVGSDLSIVYADKTVQTIKVLEISDSIHRLTYQLISSEPPIDVLSVVHSIRLHRVSWDPEAEKAVDYGYLELGTDFSGDVSRSVLEDSKWKKKDFFTDLQAFLKHGPKEKKIEKKEKKSSSSSSTSPSTLSSSSSKTKPDFTGVWLCVRSEDLKDFLKEQGFNEKTIEALEKKQMIYVIKHTEKQFIVNSHGHITFYTIGGPGDLEGPDAILKSNVVWDGETLVSVAQDGPSSNPSSSTVARSGGIITRRLMVGKQLCLVMQTSTVTCKRYFDLVAPKDQTSQMQEFAKQTFASTDY